MPMNVPVPYLDVKNFFNPQESYAGSDWQYVDQFDEELTASVVEDCDKPAWKTTFTESIGSYIRDCANRMFAFV